MKGRIWEGSRNAGRKGKISEGRNIGRKKYQEEVREFGRKDVARNVGRKEGIS